MKADKTVDRAQTPKVSISDISAAKKSLAVEVAAEQVALEYDKSCRKYARALKVDGFRQGKVPPHIIKQRFGREIERETVEQVIKGALDSAVAGAGLAPLGQPVLKEYNYTAGGPLSFTATFEVKPRVAVKGTRDIKVKVPQAAVTDRMMSDALEVLREEAAKFEPVQERGVRPGDYVVVDLAGSMGEGEGNRFSRENLMFEVGSGGPSPELTEHLRDMRPGERREFSVAYPQQHPSRSLAGRRVAYAAQLREIKQKALPDLDDEFSKGFPGCANLEDLRRQVEAGLTERERSRSRGQARSEVIDQLLASNADVPVPEVLVEEELEARLQEIAHTMKLQGIDPERASVDWAEIRDKQREAATRSVRAMILLDAIAEAEKISLEPETLDRAVASEAARRREAAGSLRAKLAKDGRLKRLEEQLLRDKILDFLLTAANT